MDKRYILTPDGGLVEDEERSRPVYPLTVVQTVVDGAASALLNSLNDGNSALVKLLLECGKIPASELRSSLRAVMNDNHKCIRATLEMQSLVIDEKVLFVYFIFVFYF